MNGPEHYAEAERLLDEMDYSTAKETIAAAQVHATLALVAATVAERVTAPANSPTVLLCDVTDDWSVTR